jgi:mono/diheme cytochrome c family protein
MSARRIVSAIALAAALSAGVALPAGAQTSAVERGNAKFQHSCAPCHGPGGGDDGRANLPGTEALLIKYKGELPAVLEQRKDLNYEALRVFVRRGTWSMPPFRKTEVTDADIEDIAAYIAESSKRVGAAARR